jgi:redox-sensitive bicupin YhaK (pirin superfamily)
MDTKPSLFAVQRASERAHFDHGWLKTAHSFSFAEYHDPKNTNWGVLRVLNDDRVAPGQGFPSHPHRDMEILTYVLDGELEHQDSMGNRGIVGPGGVQYMSAGTGVRHSEANHSKDRELHFVQMWVLPSKVGMTPQYGQKDFTIDERRGRWLSVASGIEGREAPIKLNQSAAFFVARLEGATVTYAFAPGRLGFLCVADGDVGANGHELHAGDAVRIAGTNHLEVSGSGELLLWDLPPAG